MYLETNNNHDNSDDTEEVLDILCMEHMHELSNKQLHTSVYKQEEKIK